MTASIKQLHAELQRVKNQLIKLCQETSNALVVDLDVCFKQTLAKQNPPPYSTIAKLIHDYTELTNRPLCKAGSLMEAKVNGWMDNKNTIELTQWMLAHVFSQFRLRAGPKRVTESLVEKGEWDLSVAHIRHYNSPLLLSLDFAGLVLLPFGLKYSPSNLYFKQFRQMDSGTSFTSIMKNQKI